MSNFFSKLHRRGLVALFLTVFICASRAQDPYALVKLSPEGSAFSEPYSINNAGQITVRYVIGGTEFASIYANQTYTPIPTLPGGTGNFPFAINELGHVVGTNGFPGDGSSDHSYLFNSTGITDIGTLSGGLRTYAKAINDSDSIAGYIGYAGRSSAFLRVGGVISDLGTFGGIESEAHDINNLGQVVGYSRTSAGDFHGFLYYNGVMTDLFTASGGLVRFPSAINESGGVVGRSSNNRAFIYQAGVVTELGGLGATFSGAYAVNDSGHVVGYVMNASGTRAFFYAPSIGMIDLNDTVTLSDGTTPGFISLQIANGINNAGWIIGRGMYFNGVSQTNEAFLLVPQNPVPAAAAQFSPPAGTYFGPQQISLTSSTPGATIRYTTTGGTPTPTVGTIYTGPIMVTASTPVSAIAFGGGFLPSAVTSGYYKILPPRVDAPVFSLAGGIYTGAQVVSIASTTAGATIRYTLNGTTPSSTSGTIYTGPVSVSYSSTLRAIAYATGMSASVVSTASYTIDIIPQINQQPYSSQVDEGGNVVLGVSTFAYPLPTYQWQVSADGGSSWSDVLAGGVYSGATSSALFVTGATRAMNSFQYRVVVTNRAGSMTSNAATLTVNPGIPPSLISGPESQEVFTGETAVFTASATGTPAPIYQWQVSADGGSNWNNVVEGGAYSGVSTDTLTITSVVIEMASNLYRVLVSNQVGSISSNAANLSVLEEVPPAFLFQPQFEQLRVGGEAILGAVATGVPAPSFQWQVTSDSGATWTDLVDGGYYSGAASSTMRITGVTLELNSLRYRVIATNRSGSTISDEAFLRVLPPIVAPTMIQQPASQTVTDGQTVYFTVLAESEEQAFLWQVSTDGGAQWTPLENSGAYSGATDWALYITPATTNLDGNLYRCVISNSVGSVTSEAARLTVSPADAIPVFTSQPASQTVNEGSAVSFTAIAGGVPAVSYQWQFYYAAGDYWVDISDSYSYLYSGATTSTLTLSAATMNLTSFQYRCVATNRAGTVVSDMASLTVNPVASAPVITAQPLNQSVLNIGFAWFSVSAGGVPEPIYRWQVKTSAIGAWANVTDDSLYSGAETSYLVVTAPPTSTNGYQFRCVVSNSLGSVASSAATLTVLAVIKPSFTQQPSNQTVAVGGTITFKATATGRPSPSYEWEVKPKSGGVWTAAVFSGAYYSGTNTDTLQITGAPMALDGYLFRCAATNYAGTTYSSAKTLTVVALPKFTKQPKSQTVEVGDRVTLTVAASGKPAPTYQWQVSTNANGTWTNIPNTAPYSGAKTASLSIAAATIKLTGYRYRCVATNSAGAVTSTVATITVQACKP